MRNIKFLYLAVMVFIIACQTKVPTDLTKNNIIPIPQSVLATGGTFSLDDGAVIYVAQGDETIMVSAQYLKSKLDPSTGFDIQTQIVNSAPSSGIFLNLSSENSLLGDEGYELEITESLITLSAEKPAGIFRGIQTIRQLLPNEIEANSIQTKPWEIATGKIIDYPEYEYRGSMLDVARHFFTVEQVKRYIDLIAGFKMNVLHLHLTDDQGWRIEIKSWPNLTLHGGKTQVGGGDGGYYTQEDYKQIVQYAADRYVTIIPEIDVPGHTNAALASYPELTWGTAKVKKEINYYSEDGDDLPALYTGTEVGFSTLSIDNEMTYKFIDDVVSEMAIITPGPYIHLGGDESHVTPLKKYIPFFNRAQQIVLKHGKKMIGWDEVAHSQLDSTSIVQYWNEVDNTIMGIEQGAQVIMSPAKAAYLDMQYDSTSRLGLHWAAYIEVDSAYRWDPANLETEIPREVILGIEAPLWSETIETMDDIEYLLFPRIMGYAEIGWSSVEQRNWDDYKVRLGNQAGRLKAMDIDYYESSKVPWAE